MDWYIVVKTINGRRYYYRQITWREGKRVRTKSIYIGPAGDADPLHGSPVPTPDLTLPPESASNADKALQDLLVEHDDEWEHHWASDRDGPVLVKKDPRIEAILRSLNVSWTHNTTGAYYRPSTGQVNIPPARCFMDMNGQTATQAYYIVTFHELVHSTMEAQRADRSVGRGQLGYAREELVAELGAVMLMQHFGLGIGNTTRHAAYFQIWLSRAGDRDRAIAHAKREARRAVQWILKDGRMKHDKAA